jgi:hypothetical protein
MDILSCFLVIMQAVPFIHESGTDPGKERFAGNTAKSPVFFLKKLPNYPLFIGGHPVGFQGTIS